MDKWHSIKKEGYPKVEKYYLITKSGINKFRSIDVLFFTSDLSKYEGYEDPEFENKPGFIDYDSEWGEYFERDVVAWMECPEEYKGE